MTISDLKGIIDAIIKTNGRKEITGASLNEVLTQMVDATDAELAKLSAKVATLEAQVKELMGQADTTAILGKAKLGYAVLS